MAARVKRFSAVSVFSGDKIVAETESDLRLEMIVIRHDYNAAKTSHRGWCGSCNHGRCVWHRKIAFMRCDVCDGLIGLGLVKYVFNHSGHIAHLWCHEEAQQKAEAARNAPWLIERAALRKGMTIEQFKALPNYERERDLTEQQYLDTLEAETNQQKNTMKTANGETAATTPEMIVHQFGDDGAAINPETVKVSMPKGFECSLLLAVGPDDGKWRCGHYVSGPGTIGGEAVAPVLGGEKYDERKDALKAATLAAAKFFTGQKKKGEKAVKSVEAFHAETFPIADGEGAAKKGKAKLVAGGADASDQPAPVRGTYRNIPVAACDPNPWNRKDVPADEFSALVESIRTDGLQEPILVREMPTEELPGVSDAAPAAVRFQIIAGEQRWKAFGVLGLDTIEAKVLENVDQARAKVLTLVENLCRTNLNPVEEAEGYASLVVEGFTQEKIAARVKRSRPRVTNALRILQHPRDVLEFFRTGKLTPAHAEEFLRFIPDGKTDEERAAKIPKWREILLLMAQEAHGQRVPAGALKKVVPFVAELQQAGLAVVIDVFGEFNVTSKHKNHPAYFQNGAEWVCLDPEHWHKECEVRAEARAQAEAKRQQEIAAEASNTKRKQLDLAAMPADSYVRFERGADALESLVPKEKRAVAKSAEGRVNVVTDVELGKRLVSAWQRAVKVDRRNRVEDLTAKVRKALTKVRKLGAREIAWLIASVSVPEFRAVPVYLDEEAVKRAEVKLPKKPEADQIDVLAYLAKCDGADLYRVLVENRLGTALEDMVQNGSDSVGAHLLRWWMDSDTLWLLEETEEGKAELTDQIKNAGWYQRALAGDNTKGDEEKE